MAKRFTEASKWMDGWFRKLPPKLKLGWFYLLDNCDPAGVVDLDTELADFQIGEPIDWDALIKAAGGRVERIRGDKLWLSRFVAFQYGKLSELCKAHRPVYASLEKHGLLERVLKGLANPLENPLDTLKDKDKDKDKEKEKDLEGGVGETLDPPDDDFEVQRERFEVLWNNAPGVRTISSMSSARESQLRRRLEGSVRINAVQWPWLDALEEIIRTKFPLKLTRGDPSGWKPDVDWILKPDSLPAIIEGKYDWEKSNGRKRDTSPGQRHDPSTATRQPEFGGFR
jgi:hypothetical protein